jgi:hypothetical protein
VRKCVACKYYDRSESRSVRDSTQRWGQCRRGVPMLNPASAKGYMVEGLWPQVRDDDWCGEWLATERNEPQVKHPLESVMQGGEAPVRASLMTPLPGARPGSAFALPTPGPAASSPPVALTTGAGAAPGMEPVSVD